MAASKDNADIENLDNEISINKKVKILIGYDNPYKEDYPDDIIWFKIGIYILTSAQITRNTSGWNITIAGKDKMAKLDGTAGGTIPGPLVANEELIYDDEDKDFYTKEYPTIRKIIYEAVSHFGGEDPANIYISDVDEVIKMLVRYKGEEPIYFDDEFTSFRFYKNSAFTIQKDPGDDVGYRPTSFTYPGELVLNAGDTVVTLLDKIVQTLGNYEYFYDVDGHFIFQEKKNYLNEQSPLLELQAENYVKTYSNTKAMYTINKMDTTTSITHHPNYNNIKNDFIVWGVRKTSSDVKCPIRYRVSIDQKPDLDLSLKFMVTLREKIDETMQTIRVEFVDELDWEIISDLFEQEIDNEDPRVKVDFPLDASKFSQDNWREELYRKALLAQSQVSVSSEGYDADLLAEWRKLFDPNAGWTETDKWYNSKKERNGWNPDVFERPQNLDYWLDFIDTSSAMGKYSVNQIGRRTITVNKEEYKAIKNPEVPDIIFVTLDEMNEMKEQIYIWNTYGQKIFHISPQMEDLFQTSTTGASCFDGIRDLLYQYLSYNTTIQFTCLPRYYFEPNNIIHIVDKESNINGNYLITQFSLPLAYGSTMSVTAAEVLTRI